MQCSFCGREPTTLRDILIGQNANICVSCVVDSIHALLAPGHRLDTFADAPGNAPCNFCLRWSLSSALRLHRRRGVICAPCVASAIVLFEMPKPPGIPRIPAGLAAELRRGAEMLAREYPDLAIALAPPPWWIP